MAIVKKVSNFFLLDKKTKLLYIEATIQLARARIMKSLPFSKVAPILGVHMEETSLHSRDSDWKIIKDISKAVNQMSRHTFWESMCLVKAIAAMKMLEKRNIDSTLYLGTARDDKGKFIAHAWLRSGTYYLTGAEGMEKFTVVGKYAKKIKE
ncbi:lasso peptide biosynthesis B2 protein [Neobacillus vireti]|uniref:lasso peptide biosynthesis B2 protein n=1 Tax=Neobacillus vireti TaxID=220686 RepID=UPI002FFF6D21